ncbi:MAG: mucoidy inhibitor MuiA family protein [Thermodesulforhabdaceae bacterium]
MRNLGKIFILLAVLLSYWDFPAWAENIYSSIKRVTVFSNNALVTREAVVSVRKGENILRIADLTPYMDDNSIQVEPELDFVKIVDVRVEKSFLEKKVQERVNELKSRLKTIDNEIKTLENEVTGQKEYVDFIKRQKTPQTQFEDFSKFIKNAIKSSYNRISEAEIKIDRLKEEKETIEKELSHISSPDSESKIVTVTLLAEQDGEATILLSYLASNASWVPQYDLLVDTQNETIEIEYTAVVVQKTNEDWNNVLVELSTAKPRFGALPEMNPWFLDVRRARKMALGAGVEDKAMMKAMPEGAAPEMAESPAPMETEIKESRISFEFAVPYRVNIPADNQPYRILLTSIKVPKEETHIHYSSIPKLSPFVYLVGKFKNPYSFPMLPGKFKVFLDKKFVGSNAVAKVIAPGEELAVPLGVDESIKVERKLKEKFTDHPGIMSDKVRTKYSYEFKVINGKSRDIALDVIDAFPVPRDERIKVVREAPAGSDAEISQDGIITWKLRLGSKESKTLTLGFTVEYPKDIQVVGLD